MQKPSAKMVVIIIIMLIIALMHIIGPFRQQSGTWHDLYYSYFSDLVMPFGFYFLLVNAESNIPFLRVWWIKAGGLFLLTLTAELLQYAGIYALGTVFDPLDIVMYASGILLALFSDRLIFPTVFPFWRN